MRILFFTLPLEDYLSDSLLHGFKNLTGVTVEDYPANQFLYKSKDPAIESKKSSCYGKGFTIYGTLNADLRPDWSYRIPSPQNYDLFVISSVKQQYGLMLQYKDVLTYENTIVLDGSDEPSLFPYVISLLKQPLFWLYPRVHHRFKYFKREIIKSELNRYRFLKLFPSFINHKISIPKNIIPISFSIPEDKIVKSVPTKVKLFPMHIVDEDVARKLNAKTQYTFEREKEYYEDLQRSKFGITTKRAGWDCMRHYEIAANGAVLCFRNLDEKDINCAPHGLTKGVNCINYKSFEDLMDQISSLSESQYELLLNNSLSWIKSKTTVILAEYVLEKMKKKATNETI